mgnify:CR=1 FL=1
MSVLLKVFNYLKQIKNGEVSFQHLINKGLKNVKEDEAYVIKDSLKSIVNHYYFLAWEQNKIYQIEDSEIKDYFICALGQYHYVKDINDEKLLEAFNEDAESFNNLSPSEMIEKIRELGGSQYPLSKKENEIIVKRLAINYAYPEWIVKLIGKQFGIKHAYKSIASSRRSINLTLNCNTFITDAEKVLLNNEQLFEKGKLASNTLRYIGKDKLININEFKKNQIFVEEEVSQMLVEKLDLEVGDEVLLSNDDRGSVALDVAMHMHDVGNVHVACASLYDVSMVNNIANRFKIHSLDVFQSDVSLLLTHVAHNSCDKILMIPESSSFGLVRRKPAVLLTLNRDDLDSIIQKQKDDLEEMSNFLKDGGILIYAVYTYNKKESSNIIAEFLQAHENFTLLEEKQIFAYEVPSDGVYYAKLKKN